MAIRTFDIASITGALRWDDTVPGARIFKDSSLSNGNVLVSNNNGEMLPASLSNAGIAPSNASYVVLSNNSDLDAERALTGTTNQVIITDNGADSTVVLSTPQDIHTGATPTFGTITLNGGVYLSVITKTTNYTATTTDFLILCNASSGAFTITLPAVSGNTGLTYMIKKIDSSGNTITVDGNSSETIDGAITKIISVQYDNMRIQCDGTEWWIV